MNSTLSKNTLTQQKLKILIVEDDEHLRDILSDFLIYYGYNTYSVRHGQEALSKLEDIQPNMILMDMKMPILDGLETTQRIRQDSIFKDIPIIGISSFPEKGRKSYLDAGANEFIAKPIDFDFLLQCITFHITA